LKTTNGRLVLENEILKLTIEDYKLISKSLENNLIKLNLLIYLKKIGKN
jgi:hypothetical protein